MISVAELRANAQDNASESLNTSYDAAWEFFEKVRNSNAKLAELYLQSVSMPGLEIRILVYYMCTLKYGG